jgi:hypothetical protein
MQAQLTANFIATPLILLSGFLFPIANMPAWAQWLTYVLPTRYYMEIVRGVFLKGQGWGSFGRRLWRSECWDLDCTWVGCFLSGSGWIEAGRWSVGILTQRAQRPQRPQREDGDRAQQARGVDQVPT